MAVYRNSKSYENSNGEGTINVPDSLRFANAIDRDDYFAINPSKLKVDVYVTVAGQLQRYNGDTFEDTSVVIKGDSGDDAPEMAIQYSATGNSGWQNTLNPALHKYWRWSTDDGLTWSPNFIKFSGEGGGSGVPDPYSMSVGNDGKLQLFKEGVLIQEQDETGVWVTNSVSTGTGSLHFGDLHSIGSGGENIVFLNTDSNIAWFPSWSGASTDGTQSLEMTARVHSPLTTAEPVGTVNNNGSVPYTDTFASPSDVAFFSVDVVPAETFAGRLRWIANKSTGKEVAAFFIDVDFVEGVESSLQFKYPLWTQAGQTFTVELTKDDGTLLNVRPSSTQATKPWRRTHFRGYADHLVFHEDNAELQAIALNALTGSNRISAAAIRDFPNASTSTSGMIKIGPTLSITGDGVVDTNVVAAEKRVVASEANMLALPQISNLYIVTRTDLNRIYYLNSDDDPSVLANWEAGPSTADVVASFKGRTGAVVPETGDYNMEQIAIEDQTTPAKYVFRVESGVPYIEEIA